MEINKQDAQKYPSLPDPQLPQGYPVLPNPQHLQGYPPLQNSQYPQAYPPLQSPLQYSQPYHPQQNLQYSAQYVQPPTIYQQPMSVPNVISQPYVPVAEKEVYAGGRQEAEATALITRSGLKKLDEQTGIFIVQKFELVELVLCCETQNKYNIYGLSEDGQQKGRYIYKAKERSNCCARFCLSGNCRPFKIKVDTALRGEDDNEYEPFLRLDRPCKFTCLCCNRPEMKIHLVEENRTEYLGKIVDPFNWCHMEMKIYDKDDVLKYTILGHCCQLGVWCQWPCEPCQTIDFDVKTASGEIVAHMQKRTPGCLKAWVTDMDNFALVFPKNCTAIDKVLLMSAVLLIDYRHFERNPRRDD